LHSQLQQLLGLLPLLLLVHTPSTSRADILPGWGLSINPDNFANMKATRPCPADTYGVANETFGLLSAPCKACTKNLKAPAGSTSYTACKNRAGFGYTTEGANQVCMQC
jgi:hypothetical protein